VSAGEPRSDEERRLAAAIEDLRQRLESGPPMPPEEVRRRVDAIADTFLALYGPRAPETEPPREPS
jgi:hypothetical protein